MGARRTDNGAEFATRMVRIQIDTDQVDLQ